MSVRAKQQRVGERRDLHVPTVPTFKKYSPQGFGIVSSRVDIVIESGSVLESSEAKVRGIVQIVSSSSSYM